MRIYVNVKATPSHFLLSVFLPALLDIWSTVLQSKVSKQVSSVSFLDVVYPQIL